MRFFRKKAPKAAENIFPGGAYQMHRKEDVARFTECLEEVFPERKAQFQCFGADWMGRQFALDQTRMVEGERQVALIDPETSEIFEIPAGYRQFHEVVMAQNPDATIEYEKFKSWMSSGGQAPSYGQCVGFKVPLCLGGADDFSNLEITDLEVYWSILGQIKAQTRNLKPGTKVEGISISEE